jgi:hypothetical protein
MVKTRNRPTRRDLTAAQLHKRERAAHMMELERRVQESGLWNGIPLSRRTWCARLRELELHPDRFEAIRDRATTAQYAAAQAASVVADELTAGA